MNQTFSGNDLFGLDNIESAGGLEIVHKKLRDVTLSKLKRVTANLNINGDSIYSLSLPSLKSVEGNATLQCRSLSELSLPNLETVGGNLFLDNSWVNGRTQIFYVSLPKLKSTGDISLNANEMTLQAPVLETCGEFNYYSDMTFKIISFPALKEVRGSFKSSNGNVTILNMPSLIQITGNFELSQGAMGFIDLLSLQEIGGDLTVNNVRSIKNFLGFPALKSVSGKVYLKDLGNLESADLTKLEKLNSFEIDNSPKLAEISIKDKKLEKVTLRKLKNIEINGNEIFEGTLTLDNCESPVLNGIKEITNLYVNSSSSDQIPINISSLTRIKQDLNLSGYNFSFIFPNIEEIGGELNISQNEVIASISLPQLTKIGGNCIYGVSSQSSPLNPLNFNISKLNKIGGQLQITGLYSSSRALINLDSFSSLMTITGGVSIVNQYALSSYKGLQKSINSFPGSKWLVDGRSLYSPSYQDLLEGKWIK